MEKLLCSPKSPVSKICVCQTRIWVLFKILCILHIWDFKFDFRKGFNFMKQEVCQGGQGERAETLCAYPCFGGRPWRPLDRGGQRPRRRFRPCTRRVCGCAHAACAAVTTALDGAALAAGGGAAVEAVAAVGHLCAPDDKGVAVRRGEHGECRPGRAGPRR